MSSKRNVCHESGAIHRDLGLGVAAVKDTRRNLSAPSCGGAVVVIVTHDWWRGGDATLPSVSASKTKHEHSQVSSTEERQCPNHSKRIHRSKMLEDMILCTHPSQLYSPRTSRNRAMSWRSAGKAGAGCGRRGVDGRVNESIVGISPKTEPGLQASRSQSAQPSWPVSPFSWSLPLRPSQIGAVATLFALGEPFVLVSPQPCSPCDHANIAAASSSWQGSCTTTHDCQLLTATAARHACDSHSPSERTIRWYHCSWVAHNGPMLRCAQRAGLRHASHVVAWQCLQGCDDSLHRVAWGSNNCACGSRSRDGIMLGYKDLHLLA